MGPRGHTGVVLRRPSAARRSLGADPYRRLPSIAFQLMREETPDDVRRRVTALLDLLVPHQAAHLTAVEPERLRAALVGGSCASRLEGVRPEIGSEQQLELPLVAHGVFVGSLTVSRGEGDRFDEREVGVLRAFGELAALALYNAHVRAELARLAHTDPLTGLANRRGLARALAAAAAPRSLLLLDLDGLKAVNDEVGYEAGDLIIRAAAEALAAEVDEHELAARLGGDEFVALLDSGEAGALERGARVTRALDELALPPAIRARFRGGSVGAVAALPGEDADALLRRAASHMRERKRTRRGRV